MKWYSYSYSIRTGHRVRAPPAAEYEYENPSFMVVISEMCRFFSHLKYQSVYCNMLVPRLYLPLMLHATCARRAFLSGAVLCLVASVQFGTLYPSAADDRFCRTEDTVWEISSRCLPDCPGLEYEPQFAVSENADCCWWPQTLDGLRNQLSSHSEQKIIFYVHGNWMPHAEARQRALAVYRRLVRCADSRPICFIAFSWPSERREGFARDAIGKKTRLDTDSYYFAQAIEGLQLQQSAGFIGYSFGAAVVCGAQHLLAGGNLCGYQLRVTPANHLPAKISMLAPAFDRQELTARGRYHLALEEADSVFNLYNSMDPILKRFRFFDRDSAPIAAGFAGLLESRSSEPLAADSTIEQFDCRCIGRTHAELDYLKCPYVQRAFENVLGIGRPL